MGNRNGFIITFKLTTKNIEMKINTMAEMMANGETPEILFWVGCAGSFDQRAQKITKAFATILTKVGLKFAILGKGRSLYWRPCKKSWK
jgi:heterodisulfide reductase subunit D